MEEKKKIKLSIERDYKYRMTARMNALSNTIGFYKAKLFWIKWFVKIE